MILRVWAFCNKKVVYVNAECNFTNRKDVADFYSLDGKARIPLGTQLKIAYGPWRKLLQTIGKAMWLLLIVNKV